MKFNIIEYLEGQGDNILDKYPSVRVLIEDKEEEINSTINSVWLDDSFVNIYELEPQGERDPYLSIELYGDSIIKLEFSDEAYFTGYCECTEDMEGYNLTHSCCGQGCDWYCPAMRVTQINEVFNYTFDGYEKDLWARTSSPSAEREKIRRKIKEEETFQSAMQERVNMSANKIKSLIDKLSSIEE